MNIRNKYITHTLRCKNIAINYNFEEENSWLSFISPSSNKLPIQGWKIHISISPPECLNIFEKVIPFLLKNNFTFKIPINADEYISINNGEYGETQIGKAITIYPCDLNNLEFCVVNLNEIISFKSGPYIPSDIRFNENSPIFFRYGLFNSERFYFLENGSLAYYLLDEQNNKIIDIRSINASQPAFAPKLNFTNLVSQPPSYQASDKFDGKFIPISLLYKSFKGDITIGLDRETASVAIQKRAYSKVGGDLKGMENTDRLKNEYKYLRCLQGKINCPAAFAFTENKSYSAIYEEFVIGKNLAELGNIDINNLFPLIFEQIRRLHEAGVSHNDIKPTNIIWSNNKVYLTDFELSEKFGNKKQSFGGTRGYILPKRTRYVSQRNDFYAFSICVACYLLKVENSNLFLSIAQLKKLLILFGFRNASQAIKLLNYKSKNTPYEEITYVLNNINSNKLNTSISIKKLKVWFNLAIKQQLNLAKKEFKEVGNIGHWQSTHNTSLTSKYDYGINTGNSGTIIGLIIISKCKGTTFLNKEIERCLEYLSKYDRRVPYGLFCGQAGISLALIDGGLYLKTRRYINLGIEILCSIPDLEVGCDFFNGYAGLLFATSKVYRLTKDKKLVGVANNLFKKIQSKLQIIEGIYVWRTEKEALTGAAHGSAGIAMALLFYSGAFGDDEAKEIGIACLKSIFIKSKELGLDSIIHDLAKDKSKAPLSGWCHGVEGYLWCLLFNDIYINNFEEEINWCIEKLSQETTISNASICHGMAGRFENWNMLLKIDRYKGLSNKKIKELMNIIKILGVKKDGCITWYSDEAGKTSFDLWVGSIGISAVVSAFIYGNRQSILF